jgi:hypothetical protein
MVCPWGSIVGTPRLTRADALGETRQGPHRLQSALVLSTLYQRRVLKTARLLHHVREVHVGQKGGWVPGWCFLWALLGIPQKALVA